MAHLIRMTILTFTIFIVYFQTILKYKRFQGLLVNLSANIFDVTHFKLSYHEKNQCTICTYLVCNEMNYAVNFLLDNK